MRKILLGMLAALALAGPAFADGHFGDRGDDRGHDRGGWDRRGDWDHDDRRRGYGHGPDARWDGARYRGPIYVHPQGYGYRPWGVGYRLPPAYVGTRYFIGNPGYYRLPPAYGGTRWIRVGPDALLIRLGDGIVIRAVRGLYW